MPVELIEAHALENPGTESDAEIGYLVLWYRA